MSTFDARNEAHAVAASHDTPKTARCAKDRATSNVHGVFCTVLSTAIQRAYDAGRADCRKLVTFAYDAGRTASTPPTGGASVVDLGNEDNRCSYCGLVGRHLLTCRRAAEAVQELEASRRADGGLLERSAKLLEVFREGRPTRAFSYTELVAVDDWFRDYRAARGRGTP